MKKKVKKRKSASGVKKGIIGWREWASLPELGVSSIKVKVDSGAKTSALHASKIEMFKAGRKKKVRFRLHPRQKDKKSWVTAEADFVENRWITSSTGTRTLRPVIKTKIKMAGEEWTIEVTLVNRDMMGFRMLLGREGFRKKFLVDASKSYLGGRKSE